MSQHSVKLSDSKVIDQLKLDKLLIRKLSGTKSQQNWLTKLKKWNETKTQNKMNEAKWNETEWNDTIQNEMNQNEIKLNEITK